MRALALGLAAAALAVATVATAYPAEELATPALTLDWQSRPTGRDFERHYPRSGRSGVSILCCLVNEDGTLSCQSAYESPANDGFGEAAVNISRAFRMKAEDTATWHASGERMRVPMWFLMGLRPSDSGVQSAQAEVFQATQNLCRAAPIS